jgi:thiol-disulfide isomerase/thioredoxin
MKYFSISLILTLAVVPATLAQEKNDGPANEKAQKTYNSALNYLHKGDHLSALDDFKKADKQDGGHCVACQNQMIKYGIQLGEWKTAEQAAGEMVAEAQGERAIAIAHYQLAAVFMNEGRMRHKDEFFSQAHDEIAKALAAVANFTDALYLDGEALARMGQDDAAKARFAQFVKLKPQQDAARQRAERYIVRPELARARMSPPFVITTMDGKRVSMDDLQGKVVLPDFWATWCGPCRDALPHMQRVAKKFQGEPFIILSVSLDDDEAKWKDFIAKNEMPWLQYRDGGFEGTLAKKFDVHAIPHTFTIDSDGVLQEEHIGDASIEGKLKKLLNHAHESQPVGQPAVSNSGS